MKVILLVLALACVATVGAEYDKKRYKAICLNSSSNDDAIYMDAQQLLRRSGFEYEEYYSIADDGYITLLLRIVNPLVRREDLRKPPVMLFHGANIDQAAYLIASSIEHRPEPYPRLEEYGAMSSSNRSLGFTLANNGYDVWLVGQRGSNKHNMYYTNAVELARSFGLEFKPLEYEREYSKTKRYWQYGLDDIINYEIKNQIDLVRRVTNSAKVSILSYSLSTPTTMAFLAANEDYAARTLVYFQLAPAIAADHVYSFDKLYFERLCPLFPTRGIGFTPTYWIKPAVRKLIIKMSKSIDLRYTIIYRFVRTLFGPSLRYNTNLERNFLAHIFKPVSFKSVKHYCQNSLNKKLTRYDYGKKKNTKIYGQSEPPAYDVSKLNVKNWVVVSGTNDALADATTVARLIETTTTPNEKVHIIAPGYNHADLLGGTEVDKYVNLPILEQLNRHSSME